MGQSSTYFYDAGNSDSQTLLKRITPSESQFEEQQARWNSLAEFLTADLQEESGYPMRTWLQGSYKFATQIRPVRKGEEFDIDLGVYFCWNGDCDSGRFGPKQLKQKVQSSGHKYFDRTTEVIDVVEPPKHRCCRLRFDGDFHVDVPCYHLDDKRDKRSLATEADDWEDSDPKRFYIWFQELFEEDVRSRARRFIKYLKAWVALKYTNTNGRPSSTLLTVLVAEAVRDNQKELAEDEDDAFTIILNSINDRVANNRSIYHPIDRGDLAADLSEPEWAAFRIRIRDFTNNPDKATSSDVITACSIWSLEFEHLFPLPEVDDLRDIQSNLPVVAYIPDVSVSAISKKNQFMRFNGRNEIGPIPKDCDITFHVTNMAVMPLGAQVQWIVRNEGDEAENTNDLGHLAGVGPTAHEKSEYNGRHFMDCTVTHNGRILGVRRVAVKISGVRAPLRNPPKPAYVKLRGRR